MEPRLHRYLDSHLVSLTSRRPLATESDEEDDLSFEEERLEHVEVEAETERQELQAVVRLSPSPFSPVPF